MARELLPARYPYVPEFRQALELDPDNIDAWRYRRASFMNPALMLRSAITLASMDVARSFWP